MPNSIGAVPHFSLGLADDAAQLFLGVFLLVHEALQGLGLFDGGEVLAEEIFDQGSRVLHQHIAQRQIATVFGLVADDIFFAEVFSFDNDVGHNHVRGEELGVRGMDDISVYSRSLS